jgi:hypothetical protein
MGPMAKTTRTARTGLLHCKSQEPLRLNLMVQAQFRCRNGTPVVAPKDHCRGALARGQNFIIISGSPADRRSPDAWIDDPSGSFTADAHPPKLRPANR